MEEVKTPLHEHNLRSFTRFAYGWCQRCSDVEIYGRRDDRLNFYIYGGYRCNEQGCDFMLHKECLNPLQEINHSSHLNHPLKFTHIYWKGSTCSFCVEFRVGYCCSICDFKLDMACARRPEPLILPENSYGHEHSLKLFRIQCVPWESASGICKVCYKTIYSSSIHYRCSQCEFGIHVECADLFPEAYHSSHPQHPLKSLKCEVPDYADESCLLCEKAFDGKRHQLHHCDICNFSICRECIRNPPPVDVECLTTHEHQLHLIPRRIDFTCNACGTRGDRSPYFCLQCNFMIHRQCIDLPRVININRHDHRIAYTRRIGHGEWKCRVCREKVDEFYGAYTCVKCPTLAVHARCATNKDVWDMVERYKTPEEEEIPPFKVIDDNTINHFSHEHNLHINKDDGKILHESVLCKACVFQICSEPFYNCDQCDFILHQKCANLPRKKRHMFYNQPSTLKTDSRERPPRCDLCFREFSGFKYQADILKNIDVQCGSTSDSLEHESHPHPLHYESGRNDNQYCSQCGDTRKFFFKCDECDYFLDIKCALLPKKVMRKRYDDHPLFLSCGDKNVDGEYWCEACETKVDPKKWFYTCNDCGITLHITCLVGDISYLMPGILTRWNGIFYASQDAKVVSNISICRHVCSVCKSRCKLPSVYKLYEVGDDVYICSYKCWDKYRLI